MRLERNRDGDMVEVAEPYETLGEKGGQLPGCVEAAGAEQGERSEAESC